MTRNRRRMVDRFLSEHEDPLCYRLVSGTKRAPLRSVPCAQEKSSRQVISSEPDVDDMSLRASLVGTESDEERK
jgi:hypothetical protein